MMSVLTFSFNGAGFFLVCNNLCFQQVCNTLCLPGVFVFSTDEFVFHPYVVFYLYLKHPEGRSKWGGVRLFLSQVFSQLKPRIGCSVDLNKIFVFDFGFTISVCLFAAYWGLTNWGPVLIVAY